VAGFQPVTFSREPKKSANDIDQTASPLAVFLFGFP